jgi:alpha-N-acetylglucosamine transferase
MVSNLCSCGAAVKIQFEADFARSPLVGWPKSYTKLLAFNLTEYDRVLHLDSDATVLQVCTVIIYLLVTNAD